MFKNFDKVFKFTFKNQVSPKGFKGVTIGIALALLILPIAIFMIIYFASNSTDEDGIPRCGAEKIYVVNEATPYTDYSMLNMLGTEHYDSFTYTNAASVEEALNTIESNKEMRSFVLEFTNEDGSISSKIILPNETDIDKAGKYEDFLNENESMISIIASGIDVSSLGMVSMPVESDVYSASGIDKGQNLFDELGEDAENFEDMLPLFGYILTFLTVFIVYFIVLSYGSSISQNIVLEKANKLMDTMLISVSPESLVFGKMLGVLTAGIMQLLIWIASAAAGIFGGIEILNHLDGGEDLDVVGFFKSFGELGLFKPANVVIGIITLLLGIVLYSAISSLGGSIANTREEASSNNGLFVMILIISFYAVLFTGMSTTKAAPAYLCLIPFTSAMVLPAAMCLGSTSTLVGIIGLAIMVVTTVIVIILAGKLYKMMSLYKGNKVSMGKALKMLFSKNV